MRRRATLPHPLECSTIAVPGLSFRVRKGTGRLTWAMTTAKPIQRPTPTGRPANGTMPRFRSWRSGNRTTDANNQTLHRYRHRDHKKQCSLPSNERNHHRTRPDPTSGSEKVCRVRPLVPVGSTPRGAEPSSRATLIGEQPNPWDLLQPQDATSRHRGAKPSRRYGLLGMISLLSPEYLLSVERCRARAPAPDHYLRLSSLPEPSFSQSSPLVRLHSKPDCQPG